MAQETPATRLTGAEGLYQAVQLQVLNVPFSPPVFSINAWETALDQKKIGPAAGLKYVEQLFDNIPAGRSLQLLDLLEPVVQSDPDHYFQYLYLRAMVLNRMEETDSALAVCQKLNVQVNTDPLRKGWAVLAEAKIRHARLQFQTTYRLAGIALDDARRAGDKKLEVLALSTIGRVSRDIYMTMPEHSAPYHEQALAVARNLRDSALVIEELTALSLNYLGTDQPHLARQYLEEAITWFGPQGSLRSRFLIVRQMAFFWDDYGDPVRSYRLYEAAVGLAKLLGLRSSTQNLYEQMSGICVRQGDANQAQACLDSAARYCTYKRELGYFYRSFAEVAAMRGDTALAFDWYQKAFMEQVKGYDDRNTRQLTEWETHFRTREKEIQLEDQKRQRWLLFGLVFALALLFAVVAFAYFRQRRSHRKIVAQAAQIERQAAELRQLDEVKSRFFANVSHELRTPLTLIQGPLNQALQDAGLPPHIRRLLEMTRENGQHLLKLVNELLDIQRFETLRPELQEESTNVPAFLGRIVAEFQSAAASRGIDLQLEAMPDEGLWANIDRDKVQKIVNNLLGNALKFTPSGGHVTLSLTVLNDWLLLRVTDTGAGIHPDDLPHIFERYYQSVRPGARAEGGFGIGLAYGRELAEIMGGALRGESEFGRGSTFELRWPFKKAATSFAGEGEALPTESSVAQNIRTTGNPAAGTTQDPALSPLPYLLVVEDNASLQEYLRELLSDRYRLAVAANGQRALDFLRNTPEAPDLVISDVMMPMMDGFELLDTLRSDPSWCNIPVMLLTARAESQDRLRAFRLGIDDYLQKPFDAEELLVRLENILRNRDARQRWLKNHTNGPAAVAEPSPPAEDQWLSEARERTREHLGNAQFNIDYLAGLMQMSRSTLNRRTRELTGMSANQFIQELRLQTAREILESERTVSLKAVAEAVGLRSPHYLSRLYRERFGKSPLGGEG